MKVRGSRQRDRALIFGLGEFGGGREAARYLLRRGFQLRICDRRSEAELAGSVAALRWARDIEWCLGRESEALLDGVDLVVANPAVRDDHPLLCEASRRGVAVTQEVALFLEAYPGRVVMVTGTNGKSTTSSLLAAALRRAGMDALLGGNIGHSLLAEESHWRKDQVAVLEISSFQLGRMVSSPPRVHGAVITRVGRDHIDYHGTVSGYHAAKAVAAASATAFLVHAADDPVATGFASEAATRVRFGPQKGSDVTCRGGWVLTSVGAGPGPLLHRRALSMLGDFQLDNVMAAAAAAALLGAARHPIGIALSTARSLPYRLQLLCEVEGRRLYDNSASTEMESTLAALRAIPGPVHWVGGGRSKDPDYGRVARAVVPHLASAHLFGQAAGPLAGFLRRRVPVTVCDRLEEALTSAWSASRRGHAVLISPAFSSFDQYPNFRARAGDFHRWARKLCPRSLRPGTDLIGPQLASH